MVLAFSKLELGVLGEEGELYHDCDINNGSVQGRLRKLAAKLKLIIKMILRGARRFKALKN